MPWITEPLQDVEWPEPDWDVPLWPFVTAMIALVAGYACVWYLLVR